MIIITIPNTYAWFKVLRNTPVSLVILHSSVLHVPLCHDSGVCSLEKEVIVLTRPDIYTNHIPLYYQSVWIYVLFM